MWSVQGLRLTVVWTLPLLLLLFLSSPALGLEFEKGGVNLSLSGSLKGLLTTGKTLSRKDYWSDLNRLRVEMDLKPGEEFTLKAIYDLEAILGTVLETPEFLLAKGKADDALYDLSRNLIDNPDLFVRHSLHRLYTAYSREPWAITVGRQRVAWGQARIWNPTDLFNPVSPLEIERGERFGVDALSVEYFFAPLKSIHLVYAPRKEEKKEAIGVRLRTNLKGYDFSIVGGEFRDDRVLGFDFAGNIGESGFRGEGAYTKGDGRDFVRFVLSWDYSFPNTLYILFEYLYNGGSLGKEAPLSRIATFSGEIATRNRNFLAAMITYDPTPLIKTGFTGILDLDGSSSFINPSFTYNISTNIDWVVGVQIFSGGEDDDFGGFSNVYYTSVEWFFE